MFLSDYIAFVDMVPEMSTIYKGILYKINNDKTIFVLL